MTIRRLKELIRDIPDDARIYLDDGISFVEGNSEVVIVARAINYPQKVILQTKTDIDLSSELEAHIKYYEDHLWDETDAMIEMLEEGYEIDDFKYDKERYEWAKRTAEEHGLV